MSAVLQGLIAVLCWNMLLSNTMATPVSIALPSPAELEASQAVIGEVVIVIKDVFDTSMPGENKSIFRAANRWHIETRESVVRKQLLFRTGEPYSRDLLDESERILRSNVYLFDASIAETGYRDGVVDITVTTRDVWTFTPEFSLSRSGGKTTTNLGIEEVNLLGTGSALKLNYEDGVDRESTRFAFANGHLGRHWLKLAVSVADNSDGDEYEFQLERPFFGLDTRRAGGIFWLDQGRVEPVYDRGDPVAAFRQQRTYTSAWFGISSGRQGQWVQRWSLGLTSDKNSFSNPDSSLLAALVPPDRKFVYPFIRYQLLQDKFSKTRNLDSIEKTEDVFLGSQVSAQVGWAHQSLGSLQDALVFGFNVRRGFGSPDSSLWLLDADLSGRWEQSEASNTVLRAGLRYFRRQSPKLSFTASVAALTSVRPDLDKPIEVGGDNGLRGYPLRYQRGESLALFHLEQRYYTDWYPFRVLRVGGAVFADIGRTWGDNPAGPRAAGWLADVGLGLRLVPTRGSPDKVYHIDLAFPLTGDDSIDSVQLIVEGKRGF